MFLAHYQAAKRTVADYQRAASDEKLLSVRTDMAVKRKHTERESG
jgi:hypothetical protein